MLEILNKIYHEKLIVQLWSKYTEIQRMLETNLRSLVITQKVNKQEVRSKGNSITLATKYEKEDDPTKTVEHIKLTPLNTYTNFFWKQKCYYCVKSL